MSEYVSASTDFDYSTTISATASEAGLRSYAAAASSSPDVIGGVGKAMSWLVEQVQESLRELEGVELPSASLASRGTAVPRLEDLSYARALRSALDCPQLRLLRAFVEAECGAELQATSALLDRLRASSEVPNAEAAAEAFQARTSLEGLLSKGANRQLAVQERLLQSAASGALQELGYRVQSARNPRTGRTVLRALHAQRGTRVVVDLDPKREHLAADFAGFSGTTCSTERDRFFSALASKGVQATVDGRFAHAVRDGGPLAQEVERLFGAADARDRQRPSGETTDRSRNFLGG